MNGQFYKEEVLAFFLNNAQILVEQMVDTVFQNASSKSVFASTISPQENVHLF